VLRRVDDKGGELGIDDFIDGLWSAFGKLIE